MFVDLFIVLLVLLSIVLLFYFQHVVRVMLIPKKIALATQLFETDEDKAGEILTKVLSIDKTNISANWIMSKINFHKKRYILSLMFLNEILSNSNFTCEISEKEVRETIARIYLFLGNFGKAMEQFNTMSRKWTLPSNLIKVAVMMQIDAGVISDAVKLIREGEKLYPLDGEFSYLLGLIAFNKADYSIAEKHFAEAEEKKFYSDNMNYMQARIYFLNKKYEDSLEKLKKIPPDLLYYKEAEILKGKILFYLKNYLSSDEVFEKITHQVKRDSDLYSDLMCSHAAVLEVLGNVEKAIDMWKMVAPESVFYEESQLKMELYKNVIKDKETRKLLICNPDMFLLVTKALLPMLDYTLKKVIYQDDKNLFLLCTNKRETRLFIEYMVVVSRSLFPLTIDDVTQILTKCKMNNVSKIELIATSFLDDTLVYMSDNGIFVNRFDLYKKFNVFKNFPEFS